MMATDVEEGARHVVVSTHDYHRIAGDVGCDVIAGLGYLIAACGELP